MRILFVTELASAHAARWINQLKETGWDIHIFQGVAPGYGVTSQFQYGKLYTPLVTKLPSGLTAEVTLVSGSRIAWIIRAIRHVAPRLLTPMQYPHVRYLARLIDQLQPDIIHSLGLNVNHNNLCLTVLQARELMGKRFTAPWIYSSWGTDLDFYARQGAAHYAEVVRVLETCDFYIAECERDKRLAQEMGLKGEFAAFFPAFGGVDENMLSPLRQEGSVSARRTILLKGRDLHTHPSGDPVGRAMTAMDAFERAGDKLGDYRIAISQATPDVAAQARTLTAKLGLHIEVLPYLPHNDLLRTVGASRIFMSMTVNDGLPAALVEAMTLGAFPIHSDLASVREWITDGENGLLVPPEDPKAVAAALQRAVTDDDLVDRAAQINSRLVREKLSNSVIRPTVVQFYEHIAARKNR